MGAMLAGGALALVFSTARLIRSGESETEAARLAALLDVRPGMAAAEIGAGNGWLTVKIAERVGPAGRMYSTELSAKRLDDIRQAAAEAGLQNVIVVEAGERKTNLPAGCCHAIFMRTVYHHFTHPAALNASLYEAVKPAGLLAIIDFEPGGLWLFLKRWGHAVERTRLIEELTDAGFEVLRTVEDWPGPEICIWCCSAVREVSAGALSPPRMAGPVF